ncbi:MAG: carbohydrate ABC transporter permease [Acidobacteria bacterium]|nr:carbohydrate ABC transporter permease [Acidobacteriota bacterium]
MTSRGAFGGKGSQKPGTGAGDAGRRYRWARFIVLAFIGAVFYVLPLWVVVVTSFKPIGEAIQLDISLPQDWAIVDNYRTVWVDGRIPLAFANTLFVTVTSVTVMIVVGSLAAWAFGRSESRTMTVIYYITVFSLLLPTPIIPVVFLMQRLGIDGTRLALIMFHIGTRLGLVIFLLTGFVRTVPKSLEEAAVMDGASKIQVFYWVVLPLLRPILFTVGIILVIFIWNDFHGSLFLLRGESRQTLPLSLLRFSEGSVRQVPWNLSFAHIVLVSVPLILVYLFGQKRIISGLTSGGVKG